MTRINFACSSPSLCMVKGLHDEHHDQEPVQQQRVKEPVSRGRQPQLRLAPPIVPR